MDTATFPGYEVSPFYDSMVGKLIVRGAGGRKRWLRGSRALEEYHLEGIKITVPLHLRLLHDEAFLSGEYDTGYLERLLDEES